MYYGLIIVAHVVYIVLVLLALLVFVYTPLWVVGVLSAGYFFLMISILVEGNPLKLKPLFQIFAFLTLVAIAYLMVCALMVAHAPGGSYSTRMGLETRDWWIDGVYTEFGRELVWKWVGGSFGLYVLAETVRQLPKLMRTP